MPKRNKTNFTFSNMQQETVVSTKKIHKKISLEKTVQFFTRLQKSDDSIWYGTDQHIRRLVYC